MSTYTAHLYCEHATLVTEVKGIRLDIKALDRKIENVDQKVEDFKNETKEALTELSDHLGDVEGGLKEPRKEVKGVQTQFRSFQQATNAEFDNLRS